MEADCVFIDAFWQFALRLRCLDSFMCVVPLLVSLVSHLSTYFSILIAAVNAIINYYSNHQAQSRRRVGVMRGRADEVRLR